MVLPTLSLENFFIKIFLTEIFRHGLFLLFAPLYSKRTMSPKKKEFPLNKDKDVGSLSCCLKHMKRVGKKNISLAHHTVEIEMF